MAKPYLAIVLMSVTLMTACTDETPDLQQQAEEYVHLVLALGQHDSGYVDAYYGPQEWAEQASKSELSAAQIADKALQLQQTLTQFSAGEDAMLGLRLHYLQTQLTAVAAHAASLASGTKASFDEQSSQLYDTQAPRNSFTEFDAVLAELDALLPGEGDLRERAAAFRERFVIPAQHLDAVFQRAIAECRARSAVHIPLPEHENFTLEFVQDKPWSGYNWYQGNSYSLIQINTDLPISISRAVDLGCHEGYPGHHAYNTLLEEGMVKQRNWVEFSVYPLFSPQSLIAEGTANYGIELAFPGEEKLQFERDVLFPLAGIDQALATELEEYSRLMSQLSYAGNEVARRYLDNEIDVAQAVELLQRYALNTEAQARQRINFYDTYGAYVINYNWGMDLVKNYIEQTSNQQERWQRFKNLISSPRVPSSLDWLGNL